MNGRLLNVDPDAYHRLPGFSASLAKIAIARSIAHAKDARDRNAEAMADEAADDEDGEDKEKLKRLERGSVYHAKLLGKGKRIEVIPASVLGKHGAYTTKAGKEARDDARARGAIPVKETDLEVVEKVTAAMRARIAEAEIELDGGTSELGIGWDEETPDGVVECRAMLDKVMTWGLGAQAHGAPEATIYDLKIVDDASPARCERTAESLLYGIQASAYKRALAALEPRLAGRITFQFLFLEAKRPYALYAPESDGSFLELGTRRWTRARDAWGRGLATGEWPAYLTREKSYLRATKWALDKEGIPTDE